MTIYDISEKAGVSIATVSRVLNGSTSVSAKTRQKVLDVIEQYGYTPNAFARGLGLNTMKTIGIMCADSSDLFLAKAIYYIEQKLRANEYDSILSCTGYEHKNKAASMNLLLNKKVDAIIMVGSNFIYEDAESNKYIADAASQVPVMLLNAYVDIPNVYSIVSDDFTSMYEATGYMLDTGVTDPIYFYDSISYSGQKKLAGFKAAMEAGKYLNAPERMQFFSGSHEDIPAMTAQLHLIRGNGVTFHGVIASNDTLALAAVKYATEHNGCEVFNLGTGTGYSVLDMVESFVAANQVAVPYKIVERRPGDIATCYADPSKSAMVLGWKAEKILTDMCRDSWNWQSKNPNGYGE